MSLLNEIEPLKQTALAELKAAPDLAALEQTKGAWIGAERQVHRADETARHASKEEKPAAGKAHQRRQSRTRSRARRTPRRTGTESRAAEGADRFHAARTPPRARQTPSAHAGDRGHRPQLPQNRLCRRRRPGDRGRISLLRRAQHPRRPSRARHAGHVLFDVAQASSLSPDSESQKSGRGADATSLCSARTPAPSKSA